MRRKSLSFSSQVSQSQFQFIFSDFSFSLRSFSNKHKTRHTSSNRYVGELSLLLSCFLSGAIGRSYLHLLACVVFLLRSLALIHLVLPICICSCKDFIKRFNHHETTFFRPYHLLASGKQCQLRCCFRPPRGGEPRGGERNTPPPQEEHEFV